MAISRRLSSADEKSRFGDLDPAVAIEKFIRLKEHVPFSSLPQQGLAAHNRPFFVSRQDMESLSLNLEGSRVLILRGPRLPPRDGGNLLSMPSLASILLANMLRAYGASVKIRDLYLSRMKWRGIVSEYADVVISRTEWEEYFDGRPGARVSAILDAVIKDSAPGDVDVIGISVETSGDLLLALGLTREMRRRYSIPVVIGGREAVHNDPLFEKCPEYKIINGEGEIPFVLFVATVLGRRAPDSVPGLQWMADGSRRAQPRAIHDLDIRPVFDLSDVPLEGYSYDSLGLMEGSGPIVPYQFNIGCQFACAFCNSFSQRAYRLRSPEKVVSDLSHVVEQFGIKRFAFINQLLNCDRRHLRELVDRLEAARLKISWGDSCRAADLDAEMLERLRAVGASYLVWGIDCASKRVGLLMHKCSDAERAVPILVAAHRAGIRNIVNIIVGLPHETAQDVELTMRYVNRIKPYVYRFNIFPYFFCSDSALGRNPHAYGLRPGANGGCDELRGPSWGEREQLTREWHPKVVDAAGPAALECFDPSNKTRTSFLHDDMAGKLHPALAVKNKAPGGGRGLK